MKAIKKHDTPDSPHQEHAASSSQEGPVGPFAEAARRTGPRGPGPSGSGSFAEAARRGGPQGGQGRFEKQLLRRSVARSTVAVINLVETVEQPTYFSDGDDVVPTGDPASDKLGKRPPAKGIKETDDVFPETGDPDSNDAVAHVAYPTSVEEAPTYKSLRQVARSASAVAKSLVAKKGIAADIRETMDDLSGALHELREVEEVLVARQQRSQDQDSELEHAREVSASAAG